MRRVIGIDPGVNGGYCVLDYEGNIYEHGVFPLIKVEVANTRKRKNKKSNTRIESYYDRKAMINCFSELAHETIAYVEKVHSMPRDGVTAAFKFGDCFGQLKMMLSCLEIPVRMVSPAEWCSAMHFAADRGKSGPQRSWLAFEKRFTSFARSWHNKTPSGISSATLIAEFGRQRLIDGIDEWRIQ